MKLILRDAFYFMWQQQALVIVLQIVGRSCCGAVKVKGNLINKEIDWEGCFWQAALQFAEGKDASPSACQLRWGFKWKFYIITIGRWISFQKLLSLNLWSFQNEMTNFLEGFSLEFYYPWGSFTCELRNIVKFYIL